MEKKTKTTELLHVFWWLAHYISTYDATVESGRGLVIIRCHKKGLLFSRKTD